MRKAINKNVRTKRSKRITTIISRNPRIGNAGDNIIKRLTSPAGILATGAGTAIAVTSISSLQVQSNPATEWASFAARYQQYRVRQIRISGMAVLPIQTATAAHSALYRGDFIGASTPGTSTQILSDENVQVCPTNHSFTDTVTWSKNPNAKLWNPTSAVIPIANGYSWVCGSPASPVMTTATTYYALVIEWEVEYRGSQ
jgi:hypothetical protein